MASTTKSVCNMVAEIKDSLRNLNDGGVEMKDVLKKCKLYIQRAFSVLKICSNPGSRRCYQRCIAELKGFKVKLHSLLHRGSGINSKQQTRKNRVIWEDIESAFKRRIRTGVVVNIVHKDPKEFLEDAQYLVSRRIKNILKKHKSLKINTTFSGEFKLVRKDVEELEYKYFNTKNGAVDQSINLKQWFSEFVTKDILDQLGDFQERDSG